MSSNDGDGLSAGEAARRLGVAATTVRTWDRRYGLGPSARQAGRHRRYDELDLARLALMRRLTNDGVAAAEAARVARRMVSPIDAAAPPDPSARATRAQAARGLRRAAVALDVAEVDRLLLAALGEGVVPAWTEVICPALRQVERRYVATGRFAEAEHLLSAAVSGALSAVPRPARPADVLLACAEDELHSLPLEALAAALAEAGRASRMLGARVPPRALGDALARTGPVAAVVWSQTPATARIEQLEVIGLARPRPVLIAACGPGWDRALLPPGVALPDDLASAVAAVSALP